jgi:hypothetical protein
MDNGTLVLIIGAICLVFCSIVAAGYMAFTRFQRSELERGRRFREMHGKREPSPSEDDD